MGTATRSFQFTLEENLLKGLSQVLSVSNSTSRAECVAKEHHAASEYVETRNMRHVTKAVTWCHDDVKSFYFRSALEGTTPLVGARDRLRAARRFVVGLVHE